MNHRQYLLTICLLLLSTVATAYSPDQHIPGLSLQSRLANHTTNQETDQFTVLPYDYNQVSNAATQTIKKLIPALTPLPTLSARLQAALQAFLGKPYLSSGASAEGDWCEPGVPGCVHIQQDPIFRTDGFNCQTLLQTVIPLLYSNSYEAYESNFRAVNYDHYNLPGATPFNLFNRNNFISADFNPENEHNGTLVDVTDKGIFHYLTRKTQANITRDKWLTTLATNSLAATVRVIYATDGPAMVGKLKDSYPNKLIDPGAQTHFQKEKTTINYIPKQLLIDKHFKPHHILLNKIRTPSVVEIVRDVKKWNIGGKNIKDWIGTELNVSHVGFLTSKHFAHNTTIYQNIVCKLNTKKQKQCSVTPVICHDPLGCTRLLFTHATDAYPNGFHYYHNAKGQYACTADVPSDAQDVTACNRVMAIPLGDYLAMMQYGKHPFMDSPSVLGVHVEQLQAKTAH